MKLGITGHQEISNPGTWPWIEEVIVEGVQSAGRGVVGVTCLARGTDQLFARIVLSLGGQLHVVVPFAGYENRFQDCLAERAFRELLSRASTSEVLEQRASEELSYMAAGRRVVDLSEKVLAVWNGKPAAGFGGTADVVQYAVSLGRPVIHINPDKRGLTVL